MPTTQKYVENVILKTEIEKDPHGYRYMFLGDRYEPAQIFVIMNS